jgi:hypothetical protein
MLAWIRIRVVVFVAGLLATLSACGNSSTAPSAPLDLTGTWSGQLGQPGSTSALRLTWVATHTGNVVSGVATLVKPAVNVQARGVMTGILNGDRLLLTYAVPPDSIQGFSTSFGGSHDRWAHAAPAPGSTYRWLQWPPTKYTRAKRVIS